VKNRLVDDDGVVSSVVVYDVTVYIDCM